MTTTLAPAPVRTTKARFDAAIRTAKRNGAVIRRNLRKCCRSCVDYPDLGLTEGSTAPYAYTYGGQGAAISWDAHGEPVHRSDGSRVGAAYFSHENGGGQLIADAMRDQGLTVEWDGTDTWCVIVRFPTD